MPKPASTETLHMFSAACPDMLWPDAPDPIGQREKKACTRADSRSQVLQARFSKLQISLRDAVKTCRKEKLLGGKENVIERH